MSDCAHRIRRNPTAACNVPRQHLGGDVSFSSLVRGTGMSGVEDVFVALGGHHTVLPSLEIVLRVFMAVVAGSLIGLDRELRNKPAGLRTHILISLAAALFTL